MALGSDDKARPKVGEEFDPYWKACGFHPEDVIGMIPNDELGDGPKRVAALWIKRMGKKGKVWFSNKTGGLLTGKSERQYRYDKDKLLAKKIFAEKRRRRLTSVITALWISEFDDHLDRQQLATQEPVKNGNALPLKTEIGNGLPVLQDLDRQDSAVRVAMDGSKTGNSLPPIRSGIHSRKSSSSSSSEVAPATEGMMTTTTVVSFQEHLRKATSRTLNPAIVRKILAELPDVEDQQLYCWELSKRTFDWVQTDGLFAADCKTFRENIDVHRENKRAEDARKEAELAEEKRQAEEHRRTKEFDAANRCAKCGFYLELCDCDGRKISNDPIRAFFAPKMQRVLERVKERERECDTCLDTGKHADGVTPCLDCENGRRWAAEAEQRGAA